MVHVIDVSFTSFQGLKWTEENLETIFKYILALSFGATRVLPGDAPILLVTLSYGQKQAYQHLPEHSFQGRYDTSLSAMPLGKTLWQTGNQRLTYKLADSFHFVWTVSIGNL